MNYCWFGFWSYMDCTKHSQEMVWNNVKHTHAHKDSPYPRQTYVIECACCCSVSGKSLEPLLNFRIWDVIPPTVSRCLRFPPWLSALLLQTGVERVTSEAPSHCFSCIEFTYLPIKYRAAVCVMRGIGVPRLFVLSYSPQCSLCRATSAR